MAGQRDGQPRLGRRCSSRPPRSPELAAQIYTAARIAINPDTAAEKDFLAGLAGSLGLDAELVANIDAAASAAKV